MYKIQYRNIEGTTWNDSGYHSFKTVVEADLIVKDLKSEYSNSNYRIVIMEKVPQNGIMSLISVILGTFVTWILLTSLYQWIKCPSLTQMELFLRIFKSLLLDFVNCK